LLVGKADPFLIRQILAVESTKLNVIVIDHDELAATHTRCIVCCLLILLVGLLHALYDLSDCWTAATLDISY